MSKLLILNKLNSSQRRAVENYHGPCFINAGPGSGKTLTICSRAAYMIEDGIDPESILIFTFTRKAAEELRERIDKQIGSKSKYIHVGTYHSTCAYFLRRYASSVGRDRNFTICDEEDKATILKKIIKDKRIKQSVLIEAISLWKNAMVTPQEAIINMELTGNHIGMIHAEYYREYEHFMDIHNLFDFDDLIVYTIRLFEQDKKALAEINNRYIYVMADEAHDSAPKDLELITYLAGKRKNICVILDTDQSIYSFRGVDLGAIFALKQRFPGLKNFILEQNYRSTQTILLGSQSLIAHNTQREHKNIYTENDKGESIIFLETKNTSREADLVTKLVMKLQRQGVEPRKIAVLYRMQYMSRPIEESFLKNNIAYVVTGGHPFYSRAEIKDILAYLRLLYNPSDIQAFERIINVPQRGIGKITLDKILELAKGQKSDIIDLIAGHKKKEGIKKFIKIMQHLNEYAERNSVSELIKETMRITEYENYLQKKDNTDERLGNLQELIDIAFQFETLDDFLQSITLGAIDNEKEDIDKVRLMTLHSSKGLEFKAVILIGANEGIIPHSRANNSKEIQEERRLFYVGMTRAKEYLFITRPQNTSFRGESITMQRSRFLGEIDSSYLEMINYA